jgi:hypothetical protein
MIPRCGTRILMIRRRLQERAPELFPGTDEGRHELESFPIEVMSELPRLSPEDSLLRPYPKLARALRAGVFIEGPRQKSSAGD